MRPNEVRRNNCFPFSFSSHFAAWTVWAWGPPFPFRKCRAWSSPWPCCARNSRTNSATWPFCSTLACRWRKRFFTTFSPPARVSSGSLSESAWARRTPRGRSPSRPRGSLPWRGACSCTFPWWICCRKWLTPRRRRARRVSAAGWPCCWSKMSACCPASPSCSSWPVTPKTSAWADRVFFVRGGCCSCSSAPSVWSSPFRRHLECVVCWSVWKKLARTVMAPLTHDWSVDWLIDWVTVLWCWNSAQTFGLTLEIYKIL